MGLLGLPFAEDDGGMGAGPVEVAIVAEEIGRVIAPEPFVEAVVLAGGLVAAVGTAEQKKEILGGLVRGDDLVAGVRAAEPGPAGRHGRRHRDGDDAHRRQGAGPNGARADVLVSVVVRRRAGLFLVRPDDAAGLTRTGTRPSTAAARPASRFDRHPATPLGEGGDATEATKRRDRGGHGSPTATRRSARWTPR